MQAVQFALLMIFPALAIVAALKDVTSYTIPNWLSLALIVAFFPAAAVSGVSLGIIGLCLATGFLCLLAGMGMFAAGWIGGGDAKFFAAAGLWIGFSGALPFMLATGLAGGALTMAILGLRSGWLEPVLVGGPPWLRKLGGQGEPLPYGVAIAVGALVTFPDSALAVAILG